MPLLTVIVPAYNCAGYIDECLGSVLEQLPADCELIVVDDGSTDGTANALAPYEAQDNVKVLYREHRGASAARNAGLAAASGAFVAFVDCDDTLKPGFIAASRSLMEQDFDLCIFGIERVPLQGENELWTEIHGFRNTGNLVGLLMLRRSDCEPQLPGRPEKPARRKAA